MAKITAQLNPKNVTSPSKLSSAYRVVSKLKISNATSAMIKIMPINALRGNAHRKESIAAWLLIELPENISFSPHAL
jgi:hypothetical protein